MTPKQLQKLALSFPEAHEAPHFERISYRVGTKIFATMTADGDEAMVKSTPEGAAALIAGSPEVFFSYGGWTTRGGSLGVRLANVEHDMMRELVTEAWRSIAPRRAIAALSVDGGAKSPAARPKAKRRSR